MWRKEVSNNMKLENLTKVTSRKAKRVGRGLGSGKGKTAGRGQKGQKARGKVKLGFSGGGLPLYKKLPLLRGWGNKPIGSKPVVISLEKLSVFKAGEEVNLQTLIAKGIVKERDVRESGVKILSGSLHRSVFNKAVSVLDIAVSKGARESIEKAGGHVWPSNR